MVAAGPRVAVDDKQPGQGPDGEGGGEVVGGGDGQGDHGGLGGGRLTGPDRGRCLGVGAVLDQGGGDGADGEGGHDEHGVAGDRGVEPGLALVEAEAVLAECEIFFYRPAEAGGADQPGLGQELPVGDPAVVKGQVPGLQVAADQQLVARGGGGEPRPGIPALAFGAVARGAG